MDDLISGRVEARFISAEARQIEDRFGLNPKSMLALRWIVTDELAEHRPSRPKSTALERRRRMTRVK